MSVTLGDSGAMCYQDSHTDLHSRAYTQAHAMPPWHDWDSQGQRDPILFFTCKSW